MSAGGQLQPPIDPELWIAEAEDAVQELKTILVLHLLQGHAGQELDGVVVSLTGFGAGVYVPEYGVEGLIRRDLYLSLVKRLILGAVDETIGAWLHSGRSYDLISMADPLVELFVTGIGVPARLSEKI